MIDKNSTTRVSLYTHARKEAKRGGYEVDNFMEGTKRIEMVREKLAKHHLESGYVAFADGSCWNSDPNRCGGAAYVILNAHGEIFKTAHKGFCGTTNNRMEMLAIISAVASVPKGTDVVVVSDSKYAIYALQRGGTANADLIKLYGRCREGIRNVIFEWTKGHAGNPLNEWCDYWSNHEYKAIFEALKNRKNNG